MESQEGGLIPVKIVTASGNCMAPSLLHCELCMCVCMRACLCVYPCVRAGACMCEYFDNLTHLLTELVRLVRPSAYMPPALPPTTGTRTEGSTTHLWMTSLLQPTRKGQWKIHMLIAMAMGDLSLMALP